MRILIFLLTLFFAISCYAQEVIVDFASDSTVILNDELRKKITKEYVDSTWEDYSATSTITGWSSFTIKQIYVKKIGKTVFVSYTFEGTSNSTKVYFTLPYDMSNTSYALGSGNDNSTGAVVNLVVIRYTASTINIYATLVSNTWTNSGIKSCFGQFWYVTN